MDESPKTIRQNENTHAKMDEINDNFIEFTFPPLQKTILGKLIHICKKKKEELTVQEVDVSSAVLRTASFHLGKYCENANNEFMLCRSEYRSDPRKCIAEGKIVTKCSLEFFRALKNNCRPEFEAHAECIDKSSTNFSFTPCRKTQGVYDGCMLEKLGIERPYYGYFCEAKIHDTKRPKPPPPEVQVFPDASPELPDEYPRTKAKYGARLLFQ